MHSLILMMVLSANGPTPTPALNGVTKTMAALTLFVNPSTGNDLNPCTTSLAPCLTLAAAAQRIPKLVRHPVTVTLANGNYTGAFFRGFSFDPLTSAGAYIAIVGSLTTFVPATGTGTGTATSAGACVLGPPMVDATLNDTTQTWTVNNLSGYVLETTGGTGSGQFMPIATNTATSLTMGGCWGVTPDATTTYTIHDWGAVITTAVQQAGDYLTAAGGGVAWGFENIDKGTSRNSSDGFVFLDQVRSNAAAVGLWVHNAHVYARRSRFDAIGSIGIELLGPGPRLNLQNSVATSTTSYAMFEPSITGGAVSNPGIGASVRLLNSYLQSSTTTVDGLFLGMPGFNFQNSMLRMTSSAAPVAIYAEGLVVGNNGSGFMRVTCTPGGSTVGIRADNGTNSSPVTPSSVTTLNVDSWGIRECATAISISGPNIAVTMDDSTFQATAGTTAVNIAGGAHYQLDTNTTVQGSWTNQILIDGNAYTFAGAFSLGQVLTAMGSSITTVP